MHILTASPGTTIQLLCNEKGSIQPFQFQSPERRSPGMTQLFAKECPLHVQDIWALGEVIKAAYNKNVPTHGE